MRKEHFCDVNIAIAEMALPRNGLHASRIFKLGFRFVATMALFCGSGGLLVPQKTKYTIGGSATGDPRILEIGWKPIMEVYLSQVVGSLYNPPIHFSFIAVDYTNDTLQSDLYEQGKIDFICESPYNMRFFLF